MALPVSLAEAGTVGRVDRLGGDRGTAVARLVQTSVKDHGRTVPPQMRLQVLVILSCQPGHSEAAIDTNMSVTALHSGSDRLGRIIYLCNADNTPTGGIKVIYRHAELLTDLGADAYVIHPDNLDFGCTWFEHHTRLLRIRDLDTESDFLILPEIYAGLIGPQCIDQHVRFAIFVQNGYASHSLDPSQTFEVLDRVYQAADLILSISEDTTRMVAFNYPGLDPARLVRAQYSIHERFLADNRGVKASAIPTISLMTRKMADHVDRVVFALRQQLRKHRPMQPWRIEPIHNVDEATVAAVLSASRIFLSFSDFEGLPLPPLEAALAGNLVIGYTGQGGREYWRKPNFQEIAQGDIRGFVAAVCEAVRRIDTKRMTYDDLAPGIRMLTKKYSLAAERENLRTLLGRIRNCFETAPRGASIVEAVR